MLLAFQTRLNKAKELHNAVFNDRVDQYMCRSFGWSAIKVADFLPITGEPFRSQNQIWTKKDDHSPIPLFLCISCATFFLKFSYQLITTFNNNGGVWSAKKWSSNIADVFGF